MLPNEPQFKRYRFNSKQQKHNHQQAAICAWISGIIIIIFLILGGIKAVNHQAAQPAFHSHVSRHVSKSNPSAKHRSAAKQSSQANDQAQNARQPTPASGQPKPKRPVPSQPAFHKQRFNSVNNAKEWAKATQQRWTRQGYSDYRVSSDGQGNYYLQFTK